MARTSHRENLTKLWERSVQQDMSQQQAALLYALQVSPQERHALFEKIAQWVLERTYQPKDGYTPVKGKDYVDGHTPTREELLAIITPLLITEKEIWAMIRSQLPTNDELRDLVEPLIPYVKDGSDGKTPGKDELAALIRPMIDEALAKLPPASTKPTHDELVAVMTPLLKNMMAEARKGWFGGGGGGDNVRAGSGISIATNNIGAKVISVTSSGNGFTISTPTGTVDGSNAAFTVLSEPAYIVADGINYFNGAGYTYAALTVTMDVAPSQYIRAFT